MTSSMRQDFTQYICMCIPVRYALLAAAMFLLLFSTVLSGLGIAALQRIHSQLSGFQQFAIFLHIFVHLFFALFCLVGLYGSIARNVNFSSIYTSYVVAQILLSIGSAALCLYVLFNDAQAWNANSCLAVAFDQFAKSLCQRTSATKGLAIFLFIVLWLVEIVCIIAGTLFVSQLREESLEMEMLKPKFGRGFYV